MKIFVTTLGYLASTVIIFIGAGMLANNIGLLPDANGSGLLESKLFGIGIVLFGLSLVFFQFKKTSSAKYLAISTSMLAVLMHSVPYSIRSYSVGNITNTDIVLIMVASILTLYLYYISYKHYIKYDTSKKT